MPASYLKIGGEAISDAILAKVEVTQELNQHDRCVIETRHTSDARPAIEEKLGQDLSITTHDQSGGEWIIFDGFVLSVELEYEISGSYKATIEGVSRSYKLELTAQESYWNKKTLAEVASALASEDGLEANMRCAARPPKNYVQWGESDFAFLVRIADDYQAWIRPTAGGIEICDKFQPGTPLTWRKQDGLLSFKMKGKLAQPFFRGTHYDAQKMSSATMPKVMKRADFTGASDRMVNAVYRGSDAVPLAPGHVSTDGRAATHDEFRELLERENMRAMAGGLVGHGVSHQERVKAGNTIEIEGVLDAQGTYGVFKVVHRWNQQQYRNEFWCTPWQQYVNAIPPQPLRIEGLVTARVKDHDDPLKMGRLKVQYDWQEQGEVHWARWTTPHAGGDRGILFLPEVGDEVLVGFEFGDPERPFILGGLWNGVDTAPREEFWGGDVKPNEVKRIVTKSGHRLQFSDKEGKEAIVIATPNNLKVSMLEKTDETGRPMILVHAAEGDLVFSAPNGRIHFHSKFFSKETG